MSSFPHKGDARKARKHKDAVSASERGGKGQGHAPRQNRASSAFKEAGPNRESGSRVHEDRDAEAPMLPGVKPVLEMLEISPERVDAVFLRKGRHSREMDRIVDACRAAGVRFTLLEPSLYSRLYAGSSQGVVARLFEAGYVELDELLAKVMDAPLPLILALDQLQDPGNAGTLARTLYALGGAGIITTRHKGAYLGAAAARASAGALERLPVCKAPNLGQALDKCRKEGVAVYGAAGLPQGQDEEKERGRFLNAFQFSPRLPAVLVLGSEESGMRSGMEKRCDFFLSIPMLREFDSLNVAQAGAIIISCFSRALEKKIP